MFFSSVPISYLHCSNPSYFNRSHAELSVRFTTNSAIQKTLLEFAAVMLYVGWLVAEGHFFAGLGAWSYSLPSSSAGSAVLIDEVWRLLFIIHEAIPK